MRGTFHGELAQLGAELATMCTLAGDAMDSATTALLTADLRLAEQVISGDAQIDGLRAQAEDDAYRLLSLQAPVARDLRLIVTGIRVAEKIERMGDLARHVAELARRRHPDCAVPPEMAERFAEMGGLATRIARSVAETLAEPLQEQFAQRDRDDDRIDALQRDLLTAAVDQGGDGPGAVRIGIDVALLTRFIERFADQAVSVARRLDYIVTGVVPAGTTP